MNTERMTHLNKADLHTANEPFDISGRLSLRFDAGKWAYDEVLSERVYQKQYPDYDGAAADDYINDENRAAFLVYEENRCIGQILLAGTWNRYAHIEDLSIAAAYRRKGIGTTLLREAEKWAREHNLAALSLECQDNNIQASRFLCKNGFEIGGVNTKLYAMLGKPYEEETAVLWYKSLL